MSFTSTEGNGGPPLRVSREPVEMPDIPRGTMCIDGWLPSSDEDQRMTFTKRVMGGFELTYHDCQVTGQGNGVIHVFVSSFDVVTWAKRD